MELISSLNDPSIISIGKAAKKRHLFYFTMGILIIVGTVIIYHMVKYFTKNPKSLDHVTMDIQKRVVAFMNPDEIQKKPIVINQPPKNEEDKGDYNEEK